MAAVVILFALLAHVANVLLLVFAGALLAVFLDGLARLTTDWIRLPRPWSLALVCVALLLLATGIGWLAGPRIAAQVAELRERLPEAFERIKADLMALEWFRALIAQVPTFDELAARGSGVLGRVTGVFSTALGALTSSLVVLVIGIYAAIQPSLYTDNVVRLVPREKRRRAQDVLDALGRALRWWLVGRFAAMAVVGVLTAVGLIIVGLPLALTLALLAALLAFVPFIGPLLSAVPAILIALVDSPLRAFYVVIVYVVVQLVESHAITPLIQGHVVRIPPVVLLAAQLVMAVLFGIVGVFLATPLAVVAIVLVQMLYVEDVLGDSVTVLGAR